MCLKALQVFLNLILNPNMAAQFISCSSETRMAARLPVNAWPEISMALLSLLDSSDLVLTLLYSCLSTP